MRLDYATMLTLGLAFLTTVAAPAYAQSHQEADEAVRKGELAMKSRDTDAAIASFSEAIRLDPKWAVAYWHRANAYFYGEHNVDKAIADYSEAIRLDPEGLEAYIDRAFAYGTNGECDKAIADATEAVRLDPKSHRTHNALGVAHDFYAKKLARTDVNAAQVEFDRSVASFKAAVTIKPDYDFGNNNVGVYYARPGRAHDVETAEKYFRKAVEANPKYADAMNNLGIVLAEQGAELSRQGKFAEAVAKFKDAARQHDASFHVRNDRAADHNNLSRVYLQMGLTHKAAAEKAQSDHEPDKADEQSELQDEALDKAIRENDVALQCDRNYIGAWQSRAEILEAQNKPEKAMPCYERIIAIDPMGEGVRVLAVAVSRCTNQTPSNEAKALELLDKAGERFLQEASRKSLSTDFLHMPLYLANAYSSLKKDDKALQWLDRASDYFSRLHPPNSPEISMPRLNLAALCLKLKQPDKALSWLDQMPAVNSGFSIDAYAVRGLAYEMQGNTSKAQADNERVLHASVPDRIRMTQIYLAVEQPDKAIALLDQIVADKSSASDLNNVYFLRGEAYTSKGDLANAKADYERVARETPQYPGIQGKLDAVKAQLTKPKK